MARRFVTVLLLTGLSALPQPGRSQETSAPRSSRVLYLVKHGDARHLADLLGKHFQGEAEVQVLPDPPSNGLLIRAAPNVFPEVVKLLDQLDRRPQVVAVELLTAEVRTRPGKDGAGAGTEVDEKGLTGTCEEVLGKVEALKKDGLLAGLRRIQWTAVEDQPAEVRLGETLPIVAGVVVRPTGPVSKMITYRNTGTTARVVAHVVEPHTIALELDLSEARLHVPADGVDLGKDENGKPIRATELVSSTLKTKLRVRSGHALATLQARPASRSEPVQILVLVCARILEPGARARK